MLPFERHGSDRRDHRLRPPGIDPILLEDAQPTAVRERASSRWLVVPIAVLLAAAALQFAGVDALTLLAVGFALLLALGLGWIVLIFARPSNERILCPSCLEPELEDRAGLLRCKKCAWDSELAALERRDARARTHVERRRPAPGRDTGDEDELVERLRRRGTLGDPPSRC
jgi:hypothetical protein